MNSAMRAGNRSFITLLDDVAGYPAWREKARKRALGRQDEIGTLANGAAAAWQRSGPMGGLLHIKRRVRHADGKAAFLHGRQIDDIVAHERHVFEAQPHVAG